jgi:hypothetical protein
MLLAVAVLVVTLGGRPVASSDAAATLTLPPPTDTTHMWQFEYFGAMLSGGNADGAFAKWIDTMPASCDVQAFPAVTNAGSIIAYYRCP